MNKKEPIMIDCVDVSECRYFAQRKDGEKCELFYNENCHCDTRTYCYYKDYKRKEQECEKLLKFNNSLVEKHKTIGNDLYKEIKDYRIKLKAKEQECERLRFPMQDTNYAILAKEEFEEYKKLKQTLTEIKEIAEDDCKTCTVKLLGEDEINCKRCYKTKILQKCEVLDE